MYEEIGTLLQVLLSATLAGVVGWEREDAGKAAGLRTHILVGIAATLFIILGETLAQDFRVYGAHVRFDAANLIGAVVTGISFLGAGIIIFRRSERGLTGLTTAAGILTTAAIGMLVGSERYILALGSTAIVFIVLRFLAILERSRETGTDPEKPE